MYKCLEYTLGKDIQVICTPIINCSSVLLHLVACVGNPILGSFIHKGRGLFHIFLYNFLFICSWFVLYSCCTLHLCYAYLSGDLPPVLPYASQPMHSTFCLPIHHHTTTLHYCLRLRHYHWLLLFRSPSLWAYHQARCLSPVYPLHAWVLLDWL